MGETPFSSSDPGKHPPPRYLLCQLQHDVLRNVKAEIVKRFLTALRAGMVVSGMKPNNVAPSNAAHRIFAGQRALSTLHNADHILLMKVPGKRLHDALEAIGFYPQYRVVYRSSLSVTHTAAPPLSLRYCNAVRRRMSCKISSNFVGKTGCKWVERRLSG